MTLLPTLRDLVGVGLLCGGRIYYNNPSYFAAKLSHQMLTLSYFVVWLSRSAFVKYNPGITSQTILA